VQATPDEASGEAISGWGSTLGEPGGSRALGSITHFEASSDREKLGDRTPPPCTLRDEFTFENGVKRTEQDVLRGDRRKM
jgi:hypothetical protein